ncbi:hypothetical protein PT226_02785 [Erysipelothrix rhusiopathiae]|nr:hypothetical protein [Erysipelothrix rhusiopathiae]
MPQETWGSRGHRNYKKVLYSTHENPKNTTRIGKYQIIDILKKRVPCFKTKVRVRRPFFEKSRKEKSHLKMAPYLMNEDFTSTKPLEKLSTDVGYIQCSDGLLYLSAIKNLFNNEIIAYSISTKSNIELLKETMKGLPKPCSDIAMINSDQGSLYYSGYYIDKLEKHGYQMSMSKRGHCWQNSPIENWFPQLKEE